MRLLPHPESESSILKDKGNFKALIFYQERRLKQLGWQQAISTSTHILWFKRNCQCAINRDTGQASFSRVVKIDSVELVRGPVEMGIE